MTEETEDEKAVGDDGAVDIPQALELLPISERMLFKLLSSGEIRSSKLGRRRVIPREQIRLYLARNLVPVDA